MTIRIILSATLPQAGGMMYVAISAERFLPSQALKRGPASSGWKACGALRPSPLRKEDALPQIQAIQLHSTVRRQCLQSNVCDARFYGLTALQLP